MICPAWNQSAYSSTGLLALRVNAHDSYKQHIPQPAGLALGTDRAEQLDRHIVPGFDLTARGPERLAR